MAAIQRTGGSIANCRANDVKLAVDDALMLAECMGSEATVAYMTQKPDALDLAERALAICRGVKHVPQAKQRSVKTTVRLRQEQRFEPLPNDICKTDQP